jgi:pyridoxal/pyridoxine/pyridoxamine kinase
MPLALILSSYVAASRVGGGGQQYALAAFGIDPVLVPTVVFGRHPGKGAPGGGPWRTRSSRARWRRRWRTWRWSTRTR